MAEVKLNVPQFKLTVTYSDIEGMNGFIINTTPFARATFFGKDVAALKETASTMLKAYCKLNDKPAGKYYVEMYIEQYNDHEYEFHQKDSSYKYYDSDEGEIDFTPTTKKSFDFFNLPPSVTKAMRMVADHYGFRAQTEQYSEEAGELLVALSKMRRFEGYGQPLRDYDSISLEAVLGEIADVIVMCYEVASLLHMKDNFEEKLSEIICCKVERTLITALKKHPTPILEKCLSEMQKEAGGTQ